MSRSFSSFLSFFLDVYWYLSFCPIVCQVVQLFLFLSVSPLLNLNYLPFCFVICRSFLFSLVRSRFVSFLRVMSLFVSFIIFYVPSFLGSSRPLSFWPVLSCLISLVFDLCRCFSLSCPFSFSSVPSCSSPRCCFVLFVLSPHYCCFVSLSFPFCLVLFYFVP